MPHIKVDPSPLALLKTFAARLEEATVSPVDGAGEAQVSATVGSPVVSLIVCEGELEDSVREDLQERVAIAGREGRLVRLLHVGGTDAADASTGSPADCSRRRRR